MGANFLSVKSILKNSSTDDSIQSVGSKRMALFFKAAALLLKASVSTVFCSPPINLDSYKIAREKWPKTTSVPMAKEIKNMGDEVS